jgi:hypothetical protein
MLKRDGTRIAKRARDNVFSPLPSSIPVTLKLTSCLIGESIGNVWNRSLWEKTAIPYSINKAVPIKRPRDARSIGLSRVKNALLERERMTNDNIKLTERKSKSTSEYVAILLDVPVAEDPLAVIPGKGR